MDTITHIVLGACIGEIYVGKRIGKRALLLGAVAQSIPDIDFIASFFMGPTENLLAHRGITHSLLFALIMVPLLTYFADRWRRPHTIQYNTWLYFFGTEILVHLMLDTANAYGTGLLEPFSHVRYSYNTLFVADPFFSIVPGIVTIMLLINRTHAKRTIWAIVSIVWCSLYFAMGITNKLTIESTVKAVALKENLHYNRHFTSPTPFNNLLWYIILESDSGYYVGYHSVFDKAKEIPFEYRNKNKFLLNNAMNREDIQHLILFSQDYYTAEKLHDTLVFNDLRFGQVTGWANAKAGFAFYYYVDNLKDNDLLVQRGRFKNWNPQTVASLWKRMLGN
ncbi:MAG: metal-dependent hydrolase [Chitinophagaceae bacterium]|nr:metal-dependent hydrolase [Chitinophagaceae bacterium]